MTGNLPLTQQLISVFKEVRRSDAYTWAHVLTMVMFAAAAGSTLAIPYPESVQCTLMLGVATALLSAPDLVAFLRTKAKSRR